MALVAFNWQAVVTLVDNSGAPTTRTYEAPLANFTDFDSFQLAVNNAVGGLLADLNAITDCVVSKVAYCQIFAENDLTLPASGVENENQAFFSGKIAGNPLKSGTQSIPGASPGIFQTPSGPGANVVNMSDIDVVNWVSNFDSPGGLFTISDGEQWELLTIKGKRRHTKNSNG